MIFLNHTDPKAAVEQLIAALVDNNPGAVSENLQREGVDVPVTMTSDVYKSILLDLPDTYGTEEVLQFASRTLGINVQPGYIYERELMELRSAYDYAEMGDIVYTLFSNAAGNGGQLPNPHKDSKPQKPVPSKLSTGQVVILSLALIGLLTIIIGSAKAVDRIIS